MIKLNQGVSTPLAIVIVIVLAVLLVGGVLAYQYWWAAKEGETIPSETEGTKDETADWKTYRNEEYGFEIKYPQNFGLETKEGIVHLSPPEPFFKNTLLGSLFYVTVFFGAYEIVEVWIRKRFTIVEAAKISVLAK